MEADFSGYATKNGLKCSDGRTIMPDAFKHLDQQKVPLVWQHQYGEPVNVLGHAILENRPDGVYTYGFFNETEMAKHAKEMVRHGDIVALSIYANNLKERSKHVIHGDIREVSLVIAGANPGARIDNINLQHGDALVEVEDEAIIYTGLELEHQDTSGEEMTKEDLSHKADDKTVKEIFDSLTEEQKNVVYFMIGQAVDGAEGGEMKQSGLDDETSDEILESLDLIGEGITHLMARNVFDQTGEGLEGAAPSLTHDQLKSIVTDASRLGSLKESFLAHAGEYGIDDIDILFPDAKNLTNSPEIIGRRTEWVADVLAKVKKSPFSRIKSTAVDLTADEARAKGYVRGNLKKEEVIKLLKRVTTPTTIYKKQKLDRDDIVDITEIDVIAWLKAEMRVMLDEELARAILVGDGREADDEDKIDEEKLRPIARDVDMYAHSVNLVNDSSPSQTIEAVVRARRYYKGTGTPTLYTTDERLTDMILDKDSLGRRYYNTEGELAAALRVDKIITVEALEDAPEIFGIIVNLSDYTVGATAGGQVSMFDDFDIDYNQQKYLIETRVSGALTKPKSAIVIKQFAGIVITPNQPSFDPETNTITIPSQTGVQYLVDGVVEGAGTVVITETTEVEAVPTAGYSFPHLTDTTWTYVYQP